MPHSTSSAEAVAAVGASNDDAGLQAVSAFFADTLRLTLDRAMAHAGNPAAFPLPPEPDSVEQLILRRFLRVDPKRRQVLAGDAAQRLDRPLTERVHDYGRIAAAALNQPVALSRLVQPFAPTAALAQLATGSLSASHPPLPGGLHPVTPIDTLSIRLHEVFCGDETDPEVGHDEIYLQGVALDDRAGVTPIAAFKVGDFTENAGGDTVTYNPNLVLTTFDLHKLVTGPLATSSWPKAYNVSLVLVEQDDGGMVDFLVSFVEQYRADILDYVSKNSAKGAAILVNGVIGDSLPGLGEMIGAKVGELVSSAVGLLLEWISHWGADDVFPPINARCTVGGINSSFGGALASTNQVQSISGHGGEYRLTWDWRLKWSDPWAAFEDLGGAMTSAPAAAAWAPSRLDVFYRGTDGAIWHLGWDGTKWVGPESRGGELSSAPGAVSWGLGRIDLFARGLHDNACWHRWFDGGAWHPWESLGNSLTSAPAASSWGTNRVDVFARGPKGDCIHRWYDSGWRGWESLGGNLRDGTAPAAVGTAPGRLALFHVDAATQRLTMRWFGAAGWSDWITPAGNLNLTSSPAASSTGDGAWECIARADDGQLWRIRGVDGAPGDWKPIGGHPSDAPAAVSSWHVPRIGYFARDATNHLRHRGIHT